MAQPEYGREPWDYSLILRAYDRAWTRYQREPTRHHLALLDVGRDLLERELARPGRFALGQTVATPGAMIALTAAGHVPVEFLLRHKRGDWGDLSPEDVAENERALLTGSRLFSSYTTRTEEQLWVITEGDRSVSTLLIPDDYRDDPLIVARSASNQRAAKEGVWLARAMTMVADKDEWTHDDALGARGPRVTDPIPPSNAFAAPIHGALT